MEGCRQAEAADLPRILELARALRQELTPMRGGGTWEWREARPVTEESFRAVLADPQGCLVVGTIEDTAVGFASGEIETLRDGSLLGVVRDLFVEPEARGVGVGEAMIDQVLAFFRERGCVGVDAVALPGHRTTKNFFEGHGFVSRLLVMHRPLPPGTPGS